ncbi:hypothetical protein [Pedosphaera parvula]|nr:hypothetical protein [Pedosphaera parvula]
MKPDDFEKQLQQQSMRAIPGEWRNEILDAAKSAAPKQHDTSKSPSFLSTLNHQLSAILWPCPQAWAGLAAIWLIVLAVNFTTADRTEVVAKVATPSPEIIMALKEQRRELAELVDRHDIEPVDLPKSVPPKPRSERRITVIVV